MANWPKRTRALLVGGAVLFAAAAVYFNAPRSPMAACQAAFDNAVKQRGKPRIRNAVETCKKSAQQDEVLAQFYVAELTYRLLADWKTAEPWYLKAAYNGHTGAHERLALAHMARGPRADNPVEAFAWYRVALYFKLYNQKVDGSTRCFVLIVLSSACTMGKSKKCHDARMLARSRILKIERTLKKRDPSRLPPRGICPK